MNVLKTIMSVGAGILAAAASYVLMSCKKESVNNNCQMSNQEAVDDPSANGFNSNKFKKSENVLVKLDKLQVGLMNFARFFSEVIRSVSLFIRAMNCYEYDRSYRTT